MAPSRQRSPTEITSVPPPDSVPMIEALPPTSEPSPTADAGADAALDHRGAERAGVVVDEALVHHRRALGEVRAEPDAVGVGDPHAGRDDVVDHRAGTCRRRRPRAGGRRRGSAAARRRARPGRPGRRSSRRRSAARRRCRRGWRRAGGSAGARAGAGAGTRRRCRRAARRGRRPRSRSRATRTPRRSSPRARADQVAGLRALDLARARPRLGAPSSESCGSGNQASSMRSPAKVARPIAQAPCSASRSCHRP